MDDEQNNLYVDELDTGEFEIECDDIPEFDDMNDPFDE